MHIKKYLKILEVKKTNIIIFQKEIFDGKIFVFNESIEIQKIIKIIEKHFRNIFNFKLEDFQKDKNNLSFSSSEYLFTKLQKKIKHCTLINKFFLKFLVKIGFEKKKIYRDIYSLRYSPKIGSDPYGRLKPSPLHRDTWASNILEQINFWFPMHDVSIDNSIYIVPALFKKKIKNNSADWSFKSFKDSKNYSSTPYSKIKIKNKDKLFINLKRGSILCFSGNHLHGSSQGLESRVNLETRIVYKSAGMEEYYPKNIDSKNKIKHKKWFKNIISENYLD